MKEILLTPEGKRRLEEELAELKSTVRARITEAIREARSHGDLRENAAYHEAKMQQARIEGRIADLEKILENATIIERPDIGGDIAHLGSKVVLFDLKWEEELTVTLVGSFEADPEHNLVSIVSPLGSALVGRTIGDIVEVEAPSGVLKYRIDAIE
jgi:transcription elongation factor GreA